MCSGSHWIRADSEVFWATYDHIPSAAIIWTHPDVLGQIIPSSYPSLPSSPTLVLIHESGTAANGRLVSARFGRDSGMNLEWYSHHSLMWFSRNSCVILTKFSWDSHVILVQVLHNSCVILIWFSCDSHVILMWFSCNSHVILIWFSYDSRVILVWFSCDSRVILM